MAEVYSFFGSLWPCISPLWVIYLVLFLSEWCFNPLEAKPSECCFRKDSGHRSDRRSNVGMVFNAEEAEDILLEETRCFFCAQKISVSDVIDYHKFMLQDIWRGFVAGRS